MTTAVAEETTSQAAAENTDDPQTEASNEAANPESSDVANDATSPDPPADEPPKPRLSRLERLELHQQSIMQAERAVADADSDWTSAKEDAKECKKVYDSRVLRLREVIRQDPDQYGLPFPADDSQASGEASPGAEPAEDLSWRATTLDDLGLTGKVAENLTEAGIKTLGDICDWTKADKRLTDIPGVGNVTAEKIENALVDFWEKRNSTAPETAQDDAQGDDDESGDEDDGEQDDE